jgi:hypothetical protein
MAKSDDSAKVPHEIRTPAGTVAAATAKTNVEILIFTFPRHAAGVPE